MDQAEMAALEDRGVPGAETTVAPVVASAFLDLKPLLIERRAITRFMLDHPEFLQALPEIASVSEAVIYASMDRPLSPMQQKVLARLLQADLTSCQKDRAAGERAN